MADVVSIHPADLRYIERSLSEISRGVVDLDYRVDSVSSEVASVYSQVNQLAQDFFDFVKKQQYAQNKANSQAELIKIRMQIEKEFGHYDNVRLKTTGILQATDIGIVKKETITTSVEETMISTPGYWLAPSLVALAAWINDEPEIAERALRESINRNDEKTSLFFTLVSRRAGRNEAALKWAQRYLANQNEEDLDRKSIIILDAYASGLLGNDSEGLVAHTIGDWLDSLVSKPGFIEQQTRQWSNAINQKRKPYNTSDYLYLKKYSKTWPGLKYAMESAMLHEELLNYFTNIYDKQASTEPLKVQLDEVLKSLVTDFDEEEMELRQKEKKHDLIVKYEGDTDRAQKALDVEKTALEATRDFTQLLTDAAMKPDSSNASVSTQKFALALSKDWVTNAYDDLVAKNRMSVPQEIEIEVNGFKTETRNGENEKEIIRDFNNHIDREEANALSNEVITDSDNFKFYGGIGLAILAILFLLSSHLILAIISGIVGIMLVYNYNNKKTTVEQNRIKIKDYYAQQRENDLKILKAILAEVVDFRRELKLKDEKDVEVLNFLDQLAPENYINHLSGTPRRIKVN